jgi:hypothetical protein
MFYSGVSLVGYISEQLPLTLVQHRLVNPGTVFLIP